MNRWLKLAVTVLLWAGYFMLQHPVSAPLGLSAADLVIFPVVVTAWLWGTVIGAVLGFCAVFLDARVLPGLLLESGSWLGAMQERGPAYLALTTLLGGSYGYFGALWRQLQTHKRITHRAQYDELTGLLTRAAFEKQFDAAIEKAKQSGALLALLFIDLDRFKFVNDTYGHEMGDELLKEVAKCLQKSVRQNDLVARLGGDEFIIALRGLQEAQSAASVASQLVKVLSSPFEIQGKVLNVSASVGISLYPNDGEDFETLTRNADTAMYEIKSAGKNDFTFTTAEVQVKQSRRIQLEQQLRSALEDNGLEIHYQPQVNLHTGDLSGFEVLLRWPHPELGNVSPEEFVPLAEEIGLIIPIGHWLLREACHQAASWQRAGLDPVKIAVNVSGLQFNQPDFISTLSGALKDSKLDPKWLEVEITESILMNDITSAAQTLRRLVRLGVTTALDDFGTGHSSLSYLQQLPIQSLKIDRSFVSTLSSGSQMSGNNTAIIEAICAMAHKLKKTIVAEGVETKAQRTYLTHLGCDYAQGFLFAKPMRALDAETLLKQRTAEKMAELKRTVNEEKALVVHEQPRVTATNKPSVAETYADPFSDLTLDTGF